MAKRNVSTANSLFQAIQAILALHFLALAIFVGGQVYLGNLSEKDLAGMGRVLRGTHQYALDNREIQHYRELLKQETEAEKMLEEEKGTGRARWEAPREAMNLIKMQQESAERLKEEIAELERRLQEKLADIETLQKKQKEERERLLALKAQEEKTAASENRQTLERMLANMDAEVIGQYLSDLLTKVGPEEPARYLRELVNPALSAEVLTEMDPRDRQQILPLVENKYAARQPEDVVQLWQQDKKTPRQMAVYLRTMPAPQAFRVYFRLSPETKGQVAQILQEGAK